MKSILIKYSFFLSCILMIYSYNIYGQQKKFTKQFYSNEKLCLITDRNVYCINESIYFKCISILNESSAESSLSKTLYIEIITSDGNAVSQTKHIIYKNEASGSILLPNGILTGIYYIKAYTKWMRNFSTENYFYQPIKIINMNKSEFMQKPLIPDTFSIDSIKNTSLENKNIHIATDKSYYLQREKGKIIISSNTDYLFPFCISIAKKEAFEQKNFNQHKSIDTTSSITYIPETRGLSLSGIVIDKIDSLPMPFTEINLTIFSKKPLVYNIISDHSGQFQFALPYLEGNYELFASANNIFNSKLPILQIDNDFCSKKVSLPFIPFKPDANELEFLDELCINSQINALFDNSLAPQKSIDTSETIPFYGKPIISINFSDFIELPTLQEYFNELIPQISIRKKDNTIYFKINSEYSESKIYNPLILVDLVSVNNINWVLSISPKKIKKIDIIDRPFVKGDIIYGGVISIYSINDDFAGVNLPSTGQFFNYSMYSKPKEFNFSGNKTKNLPDMRNLLYWKTNLYIEKDKRTEVTFFTGDSPGNYTILISGFDKKGNIIRKYKSITIK